MKKLLICVALILGVTGAGASYLQQQNDTYKVAERAET